MNMHHFLSPPRSLLVLPSLLIFLPRPISAGGELSRQYFNLGLSTSLSRVFYSEINDQMETYHDVDGIKYMFRFGLEGTAIFQRFVFRPSISLSPRFPEHISKNQAARFEVLDVQASLNLGFCPFPRRNYLLYPYAGFSYHHLTMQTDINYGVRCPCCFFQYSHSYTIYNFGLTYGLVYQREPSINIGLLGHLYLGFEAGGTIPLTDRKWRLDGDKVDYPSACLNPSYNLTDFFIQITVSYCLLRFD